MFLDWLKLEVEQGKWSLWVKIYPPTCFGQPET